MQNPCAHAIRSRWESLRAREMRGAVITRGVTVTLRRANFLASRGLHDREGHGGGFTLRIDGAEGKHTFIDGSVAGVPCNGTRTVARHAQEQGGAGDGELPFVGGNMDAERAAVRNCDTGAAGTEGRENERSLSNRGGTGVGLCAQHKPGSYDGSNRIHLAKVFMDFHAGSTHSGEGFACG